MSRSYIFPVKLLLLSFSIISFSFFLIAVPYANAGSGVFGACCGCSPGCDVGTSGMCGKWNVEDCAAKNGIFQGQSQEEDPCTPDPCGAPPPDHLLCYKVKDLAVHPTVQNLGVDLTSTQFGELTCKIVGNYREFCVPVSKRLVDDGAGAPAQPVDGSPLLDRICYEVRGCTGDVPPPTVNVKDQLGQRDITFLSANQKTPPAPYTLCTPAEKCNPNCVENGEGSCDIPDGMDSKAGECEDMCRCVPCEDVGKTDCDGTCVDTDTDNSNCGGCDIQCQQDEHCENGACMCGEDSCMSGESCCGGTCINTENDHYNCGGCGNACPSGKICENSTCICGPGLTDCDGTCVDTDTDSSNCGGCGTQCGDGQVCDYGNCTCENPVEMICGDACVDLQNDNNHCGNCETICPGGDGPSCMDGSCQCGPGLNLCSDGICYNTESDSTHCGPDCNDCQGSDCIGGNCQPMMEE
jgi:hypothetical protein